MYQRQASGLVRGVKGSDQLLQPLPRHTGADLDSDGVGYTAEIFDVRAIHFRRAHADPREMRRQVVPARAPVEVSRLRLFVQQVQAFVCRVDIRTAGLVHRLPGNRFQKIERVRDRSDDCVVLIRHWRMPDPVQVPVFRMMQVGETAVDQGTHEIQGQRRPLVTAKNQLRIGHPICRSEGAAIDHVTAETRQRPAIAGLRVRGTRLGVLASHAPDPNDGFLEAVEHDEAHL